MIPNIGPLEIAIVLMIALVVFGPKRLPELGRSLGKGLNEFREGASKLSGDDRDEDPATVDATTPLPADPGVDEIIAGREDAVEPTRNG